MTHTLRYFTFRSTHLIARLAPGIAAFMVLTMLLLPTPAQAQIAAGEGHTCVLLKEGAVKCWGYNGSGTLGLGDIEDRGDEPGEMGTSLPTIDLGSGRTATQIVAGREHTCALLDNGSVKCWGNNFFGQLGLGDTDRRGDDPNEMGDNLPAVDLGSGRTATQIATRENHTCALLDNGSIRCWGFNSYGQLGLGDTDRRGDDPNEMGDNLPAVDLGSGRTAMQVATGADYTCARLDDGSIKCWGYNNSGQLGLGDTNRRGDDPNEMGDTLPAVNLGSGRTTTQLATGENHTCVRLDNGTVKCWGYNGLGGLGLGDTDHRGDEPGEMGNNLPAIDIGTGSNALQVAAGDRYTCVLLDNDNVKCWGNNFSGQLGLGDTQARGDRPNEMGDNLPALDLGSGRTAMQVATGYDHTCARLDNSTLKCWGENIDGQLGLGDTQARGDRPNEMGDNLPAVDIGGQPLPVELTAFTATLDGPNALLTWTTNSETNNAGFEVQHHFNGANWQVLAFVDGHGTTTENRTYQYCVDDLSPGTHRFRLKQIDLDGTANYSQEIEVSVGISGAYALTDAVPNPFSTQTDWTLTVLHNQHVRAVAYNAIGRKIVVLYDEVLPANAPVTLRFKAQDQASGLYLLRVSGEHFATTRRVVLVR